MEKLFLSGFIGLLGCSIGYFIGKYNGRCQARALYLKLISSEIKHAHQRGFLDGYYTIIKRLQDRQHEK